MTCSDVFRTRSYLRKWLPKGVGSDEEGEIQRRADCSDSEGG